MKRFSNFVDIENSLKDTKALIEEDLKGETSEVTSEVSYSSQLVKDIDLLLAIMNNLRTGALYAAVGTTTTSKLVEYIKRIAEKIEKNQKEIDKQYKNDLKACIDRLCDENGIVKFTSIEDLEEVLYILKDDTKYEPYVELATNDLISDLINILKETKNAEDDYKSYRDSYPVIASGLDSVIKKMDKQKTVIKHLGPDFTLSVFQGYLRDKIKTLVKADSALYRAAYTNYYGLDATREAEEKGAFFTDARIEVDIVTRFLLKDTGLEDRIIDSFKASELKNNHLVKNNGYDKLKSVADILIELYEEYQRLESKKMRKDSILMSRRNDIPLKDATDEEKREYLEDFVIQDADNALDYNEKIIESSTLSQSLGTDGIMHLPKDKYEYAMGDFTEFIADYSNLVNLKDQFITLLENFQNPELNIYLKNRLDLEQRIEELDDLLYDRNQKIKKLTDEIEEIVPKNSSWMSKVTARFTNHSDLKTLENKREELKKEHQAFKDERINKHDVELVQNGEDLINYFDAQFKDYLSIFSLLGKDINLNFVLNYNIEELKKLYEDNIKDLEEAYKKRVKIILDDLAKLTKANSEKMYKLAEANGISLEKPSALVPGALKNFISFLNNCSAINGIADPSILKLATELCQAKVSIDEEDFEKIFREKIKVMDEFILGELPEEEEEKEEVEEPTIVLESEDAPKEYEDDLLIPNILPNPESTIYGIKVTGVETLTPEEQQKKDLEERPHVVQAVKDAFADIDAELAAAEATYRYIDKPVEDEEDDLDYFNDLLAILRGEAPLVPQTLEPTKLPSQGERPLFDYDAHPEDEEPVIFKPAPVEDTAEFSIPTEEKKEEGPTLKLTNPNQE